MILLLLLLLTLAPLTYALVRGGTRKQIVVQEPPRELVPLVPASWRKRHGDKWSN